MPSLTIKIADASEVVAGDPASITGKNGFITYPGSIPLLVASSPVVTGVNDSKVTLTIDKLGSIWDDNFFKHVLEVNDGSFSGIKGDDYLTMPVALGQGTGAAFGFVGYNTDIIKYSANIVSYVSDTGNGDGQITIDNIADENGDYPAISAYNFPNHPFYVRINQILDRNYFANNYVYVEGTFKDISNTVDISSVSGTQTIQLGVTPRNVGFITVFKDGIDVGSNFGFITNTDSITIDVASSDQQVKTIVEHYTVPAIEIGDNVFVSIGNTYSITETSYSIDSPSYNVHLTANCVYKVKLGSSITTELNGETFTNITPDVVGVIANVDSANNTFSIDYSNKTYPSILSLANNKIYNVNVPLGFKPIALGDPGIIENAPNGINMVKVRTVNPTGRKSTYVTKSVELRNSPIQRVTNLKVNENLQKSSSLGVTVNLEVEFDHIINQDVTNYEISFNITSSVTEGDTSGYNTVLVPAVGVGADGKIRFNIANAKATRTNDTASIVVRVTPISSTDIRGIVAIKTQSILGKTTPPTNISGISGGQKATNIFLAWSYPIDASGNPTDIDLLHIEFRRLVGSIDSSLWDSKWASARPVGIVPAPINTFTFSIPRFGSDTYLCKTYDTSGNPSTTIVGAVITTVQPINSTTYKAWSEDDPRSVVSNVVVGLPNDNYLESQDYMSFRDSTNGGFGSNTGATTITENANGTSSGWAVIVGDTTDLFASANAAYQTQVRDVGSLVTGTIFTDFEGSQSSKLTFYDFRKDILSSTSDVLSQGNVLVDTSFGGIGNILSSNSATYSVDYKTLAENIPTSGKVYAIWNTQQYAGDESNANSYALIAGVVNTNAIALGATYWANGKASGGNVFNNLVSNTISYELVDLQQYSDPDGLITFQGQDSVTSITTDIRISSQANVYHGNGNVNVSAFVSNSTDAEGWKSWIPAEESFRNFQFRYQIANENPNAADYALDKINYTIDLETKEHLATILVSSTPTEIDYSSTAFVRSPIVDGNPISTGGSNVANFSDITASGCNVVVFDTQAGTFVTGLNINFSAKGI
jgi:hypothetical protein